MGKAKKDKTDKNPNKLAGSPRFKIAGVGLFLRSPEMNGLSRPRANFGRVEQNLVRDTALLLEQARGNATLARERVSRTSALPGVLKIATPARVVDMPQGRKGTRAPAQCHASPIRQPGRLG